MSSTPSYDRGSPAMSLLSFVPYSVRMRKAGYVLVGRKWVSKRVAEKDYLVEELWKIVRKCAQENWYSMLPEAVPQDDSVYLAMSDAEWNDFKNEDIETWNTKEKRKAGLRRWDRVDMLRAARTKSYYLGARSGEGSRAKDLIELREEYHSNPQQYFDNEFDSYIAVEAIEDELRALPAGRWRFAAVLQQEKEQQTKWQSANKIQKVFRGWRVRRGGCPEVRDEWVSERSEKGREDREDWKDVLEKVEGC
jgi:hypothetical protein